MRVKRVRERQADQLADLAILNERLAGSPQPWAARQRLEYLKQQREQWEGVVQYLTRTDAAATMATIEEASRKVLVHKPMFMHFIRPLCAVAASTM